MYNSDNSELSAARNTFDEFRQTAISPRLFSLIRPILDFVKQRRLCRQWRGKARWPKRVINNDRVWRTSSEALLLGRIYRGHKMTPSHVQKRGIKYQYYISSALFAGPKWNKPELSAGSHHVMPVSTKEVGSLSASNVMTVCANHHRQLHYGGIAVTITDKTFELVLAEMPLKIPRLVIEAAVPVAVFSSVELEAAALSASG